MSYKYPETCLVIFAKAPVPGKVKTRLIPALGEEGACQLYKHMLTTIVARLAEASLCSIRLYCHPDTTHEVFTYLAKQYGVVLCTQEGGDLGERMLVACRQTLTQHAKVIAIGSDCPGYSKSYLDKAINALNEMDVVVGPAYDGGYVLLGMKEAEPLIFSQVEWGTETVLGKTLINLQNKNLSTYLLPSLHDIDVPDDLIHWPD